MRKVCAQPANTIHNDPPDQQWSERPTKWSKQHNNNSKQQGKKRTTFHKWKLIEFQFQK